MAGADIADVILPAKDHAAVSARGRNGKMILAEAAERFRHPAILSLFNTVDRKNWKQNPHKSQANEVSRA